MRKLLILGSCFFSLSLYSTVPDEGPVQEKTIKPVIKKIKVPTRDEVFALIRTRPTDRVVIINTVNPDLSPHASVVGIWVQGDLIKLRASSNTAIGRNLQRTRKAVITLYRIPEKTGPLLQHSGFRVWVKLMEDKQRQEALKKGSSLKSYYALAVRKIQTLQSFGGVTVQDEEGMKQ